MDGPRLFIWVVYDSPLDYPGLFVARKWNHNNTPTNHVITHKSLDAVREQVMDEIAKHGWSPVCVTASPQDEPQILEVWF